MNETEGTEAKDENGTRQAQKPSPRTDEPKTPGKESEGKAKAAIGSVADLIRANYEFKAGVRMLRKADERAILSAPAEEVDQAQLLELAKSDTTLVQTKQLLLLGTRTEVPKKIADKLSLFSRQVLGSHPIFQGKAMEGVLANLQGVSMDSAVVTLASADVRMRSAGDEKPLSKNQVERIRTNAIHCLLLLFRADRNASLLRILRISQKYVWAPKTRRHRTENEKLEVLLASRDPTAASVTFALLDEDAGTCQRP